jgi:hypothetical protein
MDRRDIIDLSRYLILDVAQSRAGLAAPREQETNIERRGFRVES